MPFINEKYENFWAKVIFEQNAAKNSYKKDPKRSIKSSFRELANVKDDKFGHLIYQNGDLIKHRYEILSTLGEGTFGRVVMVADKRRYNGSPPTQALKIIKNVEKYREAAKLEINVLETIKSLDPIGKSLCVSLIDWFDYQGHICISFEVLGLSVFDFLKNNDYQPYPMEQIRHIIYQLCHACKFLHENQLTHTDLKPENMLFLDSKFSTIYDSLTGKKYMRINRTDIKLIDFGSATFDSEHHSSLISTRHYRALEVILELGWFQSCDIWSIGSILFEIYRGFTLFQTHDDKEHLAMIQKILGPIPIHLINKSKTSHFVNGKLLFDENNPSAKYLKQNCRPLKNYLLSNTKEHVQLFSLIYCMLEFDPYRRITAASILKHPFFNPLSEHSKSGKGSLENHFKRN